MKDPNFIFVYRIYDDDVGGDVKEEIFTDFKDVMDDVRQDVYSYCNDLPDGVEPSFLETHDEVFWSEELILDTLREFIFYGGLREWTCWFPGHHRKMIISYELKKK